jgi:hypothetical protein
MDDHQLKDRNRIKPGVAEATRALLGAFRTGC